MPRAPRLELAGGMHHVTARTPKGLRLFRDAGDYAYYLDLLGPEIREREWSLRTFCLMPTHVHLLLVTPAADLGLGVKAVHERFVRTVHGVRGSHGHLFGSRFKNRIVMTDQHEFACLRYIARNPVTAGLCASPASWRWSAHRALAELATPPPFLDVPAVRRRMDAEVYRQFADASDRSVLEHLQVEQPRTWVAIAVDEQQIPISAVMAHLNVSRATAYRRLREARETKGTGP